MLCASTVNTRSTETLDANKRNDSHLFAILFGFVLELLFASLSFLVFVFVFVFDSDFDSAFGGSLKWPEKTFFRPSMAKWWWWWAIQRITAFRAKDSIEYHEYLWTPSRVQLSSIATWGRRFLFFVFCSLFLFVFWAASLSGKCHHGLYVRTHHGPKMLFTTLVRNVAEIQTKIVFN